MQKSIIPAFSSIDEATLYLQSNRQLWEIFHLLSPNVRQELLDFCIGKTGLKVTYDTIFKKIFDPLEHPERLEALISELIGRKVKIIEILSKEGSQLSEKGSFVIMDALVQLDDGSFANVEMQKIGYDYPIQRVDCYVSDIIMRQYVKSKSLLGNNFNFKCLNKVYCIIIMEKSPSAFRAINTRYIHKRSTTFDSGIYPEFTGLHEDLFICLDAFQKIVHNITKSSTVLEAWLMFLSATNIELVSKLIEVFPQFAPLYQEITDFVKDPKELMDMLSKELYIMDRNTERLMVEELQDEVNSLSIKVDSLTTEKASLTAEKVSLTAEKASLTAEKASLLKELEEKNALIAKLQAQQND